MTDDDLDAVLARIPKVGIDDWLAYAVLQRRLQAGLNQKDLQALGGPSVVTVRNVENGTASPKGRTLARFDVALGWPSGLAAEIAGKAAQRASIRELVAIATDPATAPHPPSRTVRVGEGPTTSDVTLDRAVRVAALEPLSYDELWRQWVDLYLESLAIEMEYSRRRGTTPREGREELRKAFTSAQEASSDEPWVPPWVEATKRRPRVAELRESGHALAAVCRVDPPASRPDDTVLTPR